MTVCSSEPEHFYAGCVGHGAVTLAEIIYVSAERRSFLYSLFLLPLQFPNCRARNSS